MKIHKYGQWRKMAKFSVRSVYHLFRDMSTLGGEGETSNASRQHMKGYMETANSKQNESFCLERLHGWVTYKIQSEK